MNNTESYSELKWLILNYIEPLVFKNTSCTNLVQWNLECWKDILKEELLEFRKGKYAFTKEPQWQRVTPLEKGSFEMFLKFIEQKDQKEWLYYDYKYLKECLVSVNEIKNNISWAPMGFPNLRIDECTIWIGSKGAHTPCHQDTYGCNLVLQIYGQKQWILFPPEENLKPTRIPYEESSVYSKLNFFSPVFDEFKGISNARRVILNPGDVLLVPHKWWHYVESLETSISVNVWLPLDIDNLERLNESIVQLIIKQISRDLTAEENNVILNPNMDAEIESTDLRKITSTISVCKSYCNNNQKRFKSTEGNSHSSCIDHDSENIIKKYNICKIPKESPEDFLSFLKQQRGRFKEEMDKIEENPNLDSVVGIIDSLTNPEIISSISSKILQNGNL